MLQGNRKLLKELNFKPEDIESAVSATANVLKQLQAELDEYERLSNQQQAPEESIEHIGDLLVKLRIFKQMTQRELAVKIGVDETQVSRDERNRYKGVSLERLLNVVRALGVELIVRSNIEIATSKQAADGERAGHAEITAVDSSDEKKLVSHGQ